MTYQSGERAPFNLQLEKMIKWAQRVFGALAIASIAVYLFGHREVVFGMFHSAVVSHLLIAVTMMALVHFFVASGFHFAQAGLGINRNLSQTIRSYFIRLPARYVPGGIWHTAARYLDVRSHLPLPKRKFAEIFVTESLLVAASGLFVAGVLSRFLVPHGDWLFDAGLYSVGAALTLILVFVLTLRWLRISSNTPRLFLSAAAFVVHWIIVGIAFAVYARGLAGSSLGACPAGVLSSAYDLAASLGYIALFAPQGWGVTELVFAKISTCDADLATGVAVVLGFRLIGLAADLVAFSVAALVEMKMRAKRLDREG